MEVHEGIRNLGRSGIMPPLRRILREAPDERRHYVHGFTAETLAQSPETWDGWAYRIEADIARRKGGDAWRGNLRELRNYVRRCILSSGLVTEARDGAPDTGQEPGSLVASSDRRAPASSDRRGRESERPAGDRMLGPDALTSGMSLDDWNRYIVTRMYVMTTRNQSETAPEAPATSSSAMVMMASAPMSTRRRSTEASISGLESSLPEWAGGRGHREAFGETGRASRNRIDRMAIAQPGKLAARGGRTWRCGQVDGSVSALEEIGNKPAACLLATIFRRASRSKIDRMTTMARPGKLDAGVGRRSWPLGGAS